MNHSVIFNVEGMSCMSCVRHVEKALTAVAGVGQVEVDLTTKTAKVSGSANETDIINALKQAGYQATQTA